MASSGWEVSLSCTGWWIENLSIHQPIHYSGTSQPKAALRRETPQPKEDYSKFPIIRILIIQILDYSNSWTSPCFRRQREKDILVIGVLLQEKTKLLLYEQLFPDATTPFSTSMVFRSQFTMSELAEQSRERCSTLYYSVAN